MLLIMVLRMHVYLRASTRTLCVFCGCVCEHNSLRFLVFVYPLLTLGVLQRLMGD